MKQTTAEDIMIPIDDYPHISNKVSIKEALSLFHDARIVKNGKKSLTRVILVFDEDEQLVGMVRRRDILRGCHLARFFGHEAKHQKKLFEPIDDPDLLELSFDRMINVIRETSNNPINDAMVPITHTVKRDDHMIKIIYEMCDQKYSVLPVLNNGEVIGVIRTVEVMNEVIEILNI